MNIHAASDFQRISLLSTLIVEESRQTWSSGVFEMLGLPDGAFTPSSELFLSFVHPDDHHIRSRLTIDAPREWNEETLFRIVRRDGSVKLVSLVPIELGQGRSSIGFCLLDHAAHLGIPLDRSGSGGRLSLQGHLSSGLWVIYERAGELMLSRDADRILGVSPGERFTLNQLVRQTAGDDRDRLSLLTEARSLEDGVERIRFAFTPQGCHAARCLEMTVAEIRDCLGRRLASWGTVADVTDRAEDEAALRDRESLVTALLADVHEGVVLLDREARLLRLNPVARRLLGIGSPETRTLWQHVPALLGNPFDEDFRTVVERGSHVEREHYMPAFDRWMSYSFTAIGEHVLLTLRSLDEIHRQKARLVELAERCKTAFSWGRIGIWELDASTDRIWYSDAARDLTGANVLGLADFLSTVRPDDVVAIEEARYRALAGETSVDIDVYSTDASGRTRRLRIRGGSDKSAGGHAARLRGVVFELRDDNPGDTPRVNSSSKLRSSSHAITGAQVRAARGALRWSVRELSERSDVSVATINRFEAGSKAVTARDSSVSALQRVLIAHGVSFFSDDSGYPAIALDPSAVLQGNGSTIEDGMLGSAEAA